MAYDLCESESSEIIDVVPFFLHIVNSLNCKILSIYPLKKKKTENKEVETAIYKSKMCHAICAYIQHFSHMCVR